MNRSPISALSWLFALGSLALAAFLLVYYVQLLEISVARGNQVKYSQQESAKPQVRNLLGRLN